MALVLTCHFLCASHVARCWRNPYVVARCSLEGAAGRRGLFGRTIDPQHVDDKVPSPGEPVRAGVALRNLRESSPSAPPPCSCGRCSGLARTYAHQHTYLMIGTIPNRNLNQLDLEIEPWLLRWLLILKGGIPSVIFAWMSWKIRVRPDVTMSFASSASVESSKLLVGVLLVLFADP